MTTARLTFIKDKDAVNNAQMKDKITKEYYHRVRQIVKTELNSKNKVTAINTLVVPVVTYR